MTTKTDMKTGNQPGIGTYVCKKCKAEVKLDDRGDTLPPCPSCKGTQFEKPKPVLDTSNEVIIVNSEAHQRFSTTSTIGKFIEVVLKPGLNELTKEQWELCKDDKSVHKVEGGKK